MYMFFFFFKTKCIHIHCSRLHGVMGCVLGYRSDYGRWTRVRSLLGAKNFISKKIGYQYK